MKKSYMVLIYSTNKEENVIKYQAKNYIEAIKIIKKYLDKGYYATIYNLSHILTDDKDMKDIVSDFIHKVQSYPDNTDICRGYLNSLL